MATEYEEKFPLNEKDWDLYIKTKTDIKEIQDSRARGIIFRSKAKWAELGEKNTKYFYSLEKTRSNAKSATSLITDNNTLLTEVKEILDEQEDYYTKLYKKDADVHYNIKNNSNFA